MTDPELNAMQVLLEEFEALDRAAIARIMTWVADRYGFDHCVYEEASFSPKPHRRNSRAVTEALLRSAEPPV
jgi:adenosine deaminase